MAGLTIGAVNLEVERFAEGAPVAVGETSRAFDGSARSAVRAVKRTFSATTGLYGKTTYDALQAACALDTPVACTGDCLLGDTVTCIVRPSYDLVGVGTEEDGYKFVYRFTLEMQEA